MLDPPPNVCRDVCGHPYALATMNSRSVAPSTSLTTVSIAVGSFGSPTLPLASGPRCP